MIVGKKIIGGLTGLLGACVLSSAVYAADYNLKLHHLLSPKSLAHTAMLVPWVKQIEDKTGGRVKIEIYPAMSLGGKPPQLIKQARDGAG